jgi:hypothetical protein
MGPDGTSNSISAVSQINPMALIAAAELGNAIGPASLLHLLKLKTSCVLDAHLCLPPVMLQSTWKLKILS